MLAFFQLYPLETSFSPVYLCYAFLLFFFNSTSLLFGVARCPGPRISHFSNESWFLLLKNGIINQALVSDERRHWMCPLLLECQLPSQQMGIYVCVPTHIHVHIYFLYLTGKHGILKVVKYTHFTILVIFKYTFLWHIVHSYCTNTTTTIHHQNFFIPPTSPVEILPISHFSKSSVTSVLLCLSTVCEFN